MVHDTWNLTAHSEDAALDTTLLILVHTGRVGVQVANVSLEMTASSQIIASCEHIFEYLCFSIRIS